MAWSNTWEQNKPLPEISEEEVEILKRAKERFIYCVTWEAEARIRFDYDYKFSNADTHNKYQWDSDLVTSREDEDKPCLTINKTYQHNLLVINDAKQNKPGIRIRPVGDEASFEAANIWQELIYHIEYFSNAENVYDNGMSFQVQGGIGYWRIATDYIDDKSFDQEVYIRRIKDPRSVYLDPDINEQDGSDARFGFIFEDVPNEIFKKNYPKFAELINTSTLDNAGYQDAWLTKNHTRIAEYYERTEKEEKLVVFYNQQGEQELGLYKDLNPEGKAYYAQVKNEPTSRERTVIVNSIEWFKLAGNRVVERKPWLGKFVPIVRCVGVETVIDGILDRKGHTRALINAQQIYNYNSSASVEFGALQTKSPWVAPSAAIENYEEYYKTANTKNHAYLPYNHIDEDGNPIPPPTRPTSPQASPAYVEQMKIAQNEMMMASGQYQSQFGENENAKSGVAINARQRQGDRATYHFIDNQAIAIRYTGKILIDLVPKIYDTKRLRAITAGDGTLMNVQIDPNAEQGFKDVSDPNKPKTDNGQKVKEIVFNPNVGIYDIQSDTGPSFATKRMETVNALTQIAASDKGFMQIGGDVFFSVLDFPKADVLAERYKRMIPPNITGEGPDPKTEEIMHQASDKIQQLQGAVVDLHKQLKDKEDEMRIAHLELDLKLKIADATQARLDYEAETKRTVALGNSGPGISVEQIQPVLKQLLAGMMQNGELVGPGPHEGGTPIGIQSEPQQEEPPVEGAKKAADGQWYVQKDGQYHKVEMTENA